MMQLRRLKLDNYKTVTDNMWSGACIPLDVLLPRLSGEYVATRATVWISPVTSAYVWNNMKIENLVE